MENIYSYLTPIALSLVLLELVYSFLLKKDYFNFQDSVANIGTAIINQCMNLLVLYLVIVSFGYLYEHYRFFTIERNLLNWVVLFFCIDFLFYWFHRLGHSINILWAAHSPHHSSEEFNLFVGLRASLTQRLLSFSFFWPLALIGFDPEFIYMTTGVHLIMGFWHHTRAIGKLGWLEEIFNTPSHHRVHHGTNEKYLDKNFAEFLILWDRLFGTFQREVEPVCYGILRHPKTWSPIGINFDFWRMLWQDMLETPKWWDKVRLWFMPLGWRPPGVSYRAVVKPYDLSEQKKFQTPMDHRFKSFLVFNILFALLVMYFTITKDIGLELSQRLYLSSLLFIMVYHWSLVLEAKRTTTLLAVALIPLQVIALLMIAPHAHLMLKLLFSGFLLFNALFLLKLAAKDLTWSRVE